MNDIKMPFALDEKEQLIEINDAIKKGNYYCPSCNQLVIVRKGNIRVHHYSHRKSDFCSQETVIHKTAKLLLQKSVSDWKKGLIQAPKINRKCQICFSKVPQPLPDKVKRAELEKKLKNGSIIDVALMGSNKILAGIEVRVTHEVGSEKAESLPIPFIEIDGYEYVENQNEINVLLDKFNPLTCLECKEKYKNYISRAKNLAKQCKIELPNFYYRFGISNCWKCKKEILVFTWPNHSTHSKNEPTKKPKPSTIAWKYSKTARSKYWVNCCPYCDSIQGDFFLYHEPDEPFFDFNVGNDSNEDYYIDMLKIANRFYYYR